MKDVIIITIIIALIIISNFLIENYLNKTSQDLVKELEEIKELIKNNNEEAKKKIDNFEEEWKKINPVWATIVMHQELDNIYQALIKVKSYAENDEITDALQEIETAIFFANHVRDRERVCLKNIF